MDARLRILETLYRFDVDELVHAQLVQDVAARYWRTRGAILIVRARLRGDEPEFLLPPTTRNDSRFDDAARRVFPYVPSDEVRAVSWDVPSYGCAEEARGRGELHDQTVAGKLQQVGVQDVFGFCSGTAEGCVICMITPIPEAISTPTRERRYWLPLSAHLGAAWRLRQRLESGVAVEQLADAVLDPDGRCLSEPGEQHVHGDLRRRLRELVQQRERERNSCTASEGIWSELIDGRWTLIDHFEASGRRVILAVRNAPVGESLCRLTRRERDVLGLARASSSNKEIALTLNRSISSVTRILQSVSAKLGAAIADLIQFPASDTVQCRTMMFGNSLLKAVVQSCSDEWRTMLSPAERSVVAGVLRGHSNQRIAQMRNRSTRTVVNQLASAFEKLQVHSRRELVVKLSGGVLVCRDGS